MGKKEVFLKRGPVPVRLTIMVREPQPVPKMTNSVVAAAAAGFKSKASAAVKMA